MLTITKTRMRQQPALIVRGPDLVDTQSQFAAWMVNEGYPLAQYPNWPNMTWTSSITGTGTVVANGSNAYLTCGSSGIGSTTATGVYNYTGTNALVGIFLSQYTSSGTNVALSIEGFTGGRQIFDRGVTQAGVGTYVIEFVVPPGTLEIECFLDTSSGNSSTVRLSLNTLSTPALPSLGLLQNNNTELVYIGTNAVNFLLSKGLPAYTPETNRTGQQVSVWNYEVITAP